VRIVGFLAIFTLVLAGALAVAGFVDHLWTLALLPGAILGLDTFMREFHG